MDPAQKGLPILICFFCYMHRVATAVCAWSLNGSPNLFKKHPAPFLKLPVNCQSKCFCSLFPVGEDINVFILEARVHVQLLLN